ncbi:hypothetical protein [Pseudomonas syringae]|uniref:hypothetical protein n=1 Tax=Pseudomonas syringae TaxID=317 RepID=UPI001372734B|nr:hypothetical protein [Pseudomonas syringae]NAT22096.1 hypothetical protein [Pseudomonas syringae pv. actinidifoliorum]NAT37891.1 hypothetical protein [Pseudomonas syringae pv. actinidifoliorum]
MILLSDNDLIIKLAQCDLLYESLTWLEADATDCFVLQSFQYSLQLKDPDKSIAKYVGSPQAYDRICTFYEACSVLGEADVDFELIDHMEQISEIDPGEFALFLHARHQYDKLEDFKVLTGDKRALSAICAYGDFELAFPFLPGNVECVESTMLNLINIFGYKYVNERVSKAKHEVIEKKYDKVLRAAFGSNRMEQHCGECLRSYMSGMEALFNQPMD